MGYTILLLLLELFLVNAYQMRYGLENVHARNRNGEQKLPGFVNKVRALTVYLSLADGFVPIRRSIEREKDLTKRQLLEKFREHIAQIPLEKKLQTITYLKEVEVGFSVGTTASPVAYDRLPA